MITVTLDISSSETGCAAKQNDKLIWATTAKKQKTENDTILYIQKRIQDFLQTTNQDHYTIICETPKAPFVGYVAYAKQKEYLGIWKSQFIIELTKKQCSFEFVEIQKIQWSKFYCDWKILKQELKDEKKVSNAKASSIYNLDITNDNLADALNMLNVSDKIYAEYLQKAKK